MSDLKQVVKTKKAPAGIPGVLNQAIIANGMVFCAYDGIDI